LGHAWPQKSRGSVKLKEYRRQSYRYYFKARAPVRRLQQLLQNATAAAPKRYSSCSKTLQLLSQTATAVVSRCYGGSSHGHTWRALNHPSGADFTVESTHCTRRTFPSHQDRDRQFRGLFGELRFALHVAVCKFCMNTTATLCCFLTQRNGVSQWESNVLADTR
jgi:hypothetical protein